MDDATFMDMALAEAARSAAEGETAVAAVLVRNGQAIACSGSRTGAGGNPLRHAETEVIRLGCEAVGDAALADCTLYSTMEPCPMCAWAIVLAGIPRLVLGARFADLDRPDLGHYAIEKLFALTGRGPTLVTGVRAAEATEARRAWARRTGRRL